MDIKIIPLNIFPYQDYSLELSGNDLFMFALGSIVMIMLLITYYNKISKRESNKNMSDESKPLYVYKDVLLQESCSEANEIPKSSSVSIVLRVIAFLLVLFVLFIPLHQLLNIQ